MYRLTVLCIAMAQILSGQEELLSKGPTTEQVEESQEKPIESTEQLQKELDVAKKEFQKATEMFNPWYAGPLLTGGAHLMKPGYIGFQPYIFVRDTYAVYNRNRHSVSLEHKRIQLNPAVAPLIQAGVTSWMDVSASIGGVSNWQDGKNSGGFSDMSATVGFGLLNEDVYTPAIKFSISETFPTGRYQNLSQGNLFLDATGSGAYTTSFRLAIAKLTLWDTQHPLNLRATFSYALSTTVHVKGLNSYGGVANTNGKVRPGNQFNASVGMEWSFTQKWVFANDFVYVVSNRDKFTGFRGTTSTGATAIVGAPSSDAFSLAPAIEYNPTPDLGFLAGVWFTVTGRNTSNFISAVLSVTYVFPVYSSKYPSGEEIGN
ncbi:MAG: hypothetical protein RL235_294 [Chlamydiota bacterium]|jgi:hypothetical protein